MIRTIIVGVNGAMGRLVAEIFSADPAFEIVAGVDVQPQAFAHPFPVAAAPAELEVEADLLVDFSKPAALQANLDYALAHGLSMVIATTGYTPEQKAAIAEAAKQIPVFFTANFSLGVNLQDLLCRQAAVLFGQSADIEIVERHHHRKVDAPSGTALLLANGINQATGGIYHYHCGRNGSDCKRDPFEIGIQAVRGGNVAGDHEVSFYTEQEILTISHHAADRKVFAVGALRAAHFLITQGPGLYSMQDLMTGDPEGALDVRMGGCIAKVQCSASEANVLLAALPEAKIYLDHFSIIAAPGGVLLSLATGAESAQPLQALAARIAPCAICELTEGLTRYAAEVQLSSAEVLTLLQKLEAQHIPVVYNTYADGKLELYTAEAHTTAVCDLLEALC